MTPRFSDDSRPMPLDRPIRVLLAGPLYVGHVRRWAERAVALGCTVTVAGHVRPERRLVDVADLAESVHVVPEELRNRGSAQCVAWLREVVRTVRPDLIHAHWLPAWAYFATALSRPRPPVLVTPWGSDVYLASGVARARGDRALALADGALALSSHMQVEMVARGAPQGRIHRVDLGVDLKRFRPAAADERGRLMREYGLAGGPIVLSFRAGTSLYNLDVVLEAFRILRARLPTATLLLIHTDAPLAREVRIALRDPGAQEGVRIVGAVAHADMPKYMRMASAGVSIPSSDGSPSSVWEALACGLPVVASDLPQIRERVGHGNGAVLIDPTPETLASALVEIAANEDRREEMAHAARRWGIANADARAQTPRLGRVYASLVGGAGSQAGAVWSGGKRPFARRP